MGVDSLEGLTHIHFVGIKGVGMASLALCAQDLGIKVTGSDVEEVFVTDETLAKHGISWNLGFSEANLDPRPDLVVTTGAHGGLSNPEVVAAKNMGIPAITLSQAQGLFVKGKDTIAVCGVGGKTTTASMIVTLLDMAGLHPSFAVGVGDIFSLGTPGRYDKKSRHFILEADEFAVSPGIDNRPRWTFLSPKILVVTNIEHDHPDIYPTFEDTKRVFKEFIKKVPQNGLVIVCSDNKNDLEVLHGVDVPIQTYGSGPGTDWVITPEEIYENAAHFSIVDTRNDHMLYDLVLRVPGRFNILNATAAFVVGKFLGITDEKLVDGISAYVGCRRRVEKVGEKNGIEVWDDYAYHPTEIKAVLKAFREWFPKRRVVAVFQPHTYSRTKVLFHQFAKSFADSDAVFLMDIYASARETDNLGVTSEILARETSRYHKTVFYSGDHKETLKKVLDFIEAGDIVLTLGAGNVFNLDKEVLAGL